MSTQIPDQKIKLVKVIEPRVNVYNKAERVYAVVKGAQRTTYGVKTSTSYSTSSIQINANPPSPQTIVSRNCYLRLRLKFTSTGPDFAIGTSDAPRQFPISSIMDEVTATINNANVSQSMNRVIHPLMRYNQSIHGAQSKYNSMSPSQADQYQDYGDFADAKIGGTARNVFALYGENSAQPSRGGTARLDDGADAKVAVYEFTEPMFLSPFLFSGAVESGFVGVSTMTFNFKLGDLARAWSSATPAMLASSVVVSIEAAPSMLFTYLTPPSDMVLPKSINYPYFQLQPFDTGTAVPLAAGAQQTIQSLNIQLNSIPKRLYIYARRRDADRTLLTTDCYAAIQSCVVSFNNNSGLLSDASQQDLYNISVENGCNLSWGQWSQYTGSVLALEFGKDISLGDLGAGVSGTFQLQVNLTIKNTSKNPVQYQMSILPVREGVMNIKDGITTTSLGFLTAAQIKAAPVDAELEYHQLANVYGGGFFSSLKSLVRKISRVGRKVLPALSKIVPGASKLAPVFDVVDTVIGTGGRAKRGGVLVGGKRMSRKELTRRLMM